MLHGGTAVLCCLLFLCLGAIFLPYPGVQNDEAIFGQPLYPPYYFEGAVHLFRTDVPTMLMSYLGTLKAGLYALLFHMWRPSITSVRVPMLVVGAITVWLTFLLMRRLSGARAGLVAAILLATDASFLLTTCFDWGPVALQHLLLVSGVLLLVRSYQDGGRWSYALAFLLFGLALWDKSLFVWALTGLGAGLLAANPRALLRSLRPMKIATALLCLALGALPLILYNIDKSGATFRTNAVFSAKEMPQKFELLRRTVNGSALEGYLTNENWASAPREPQSRLERFSLWFHDHISRRSSNFIEPALIAALLLAPFLWRSPARRLVVFFLVFLCVTWVQMAMTTGAGGAAHHAVLLWPFPLCFIAVVFAEISQRLRAAGKPVLIACVAFLALSNLAVDNQYLAEFIHNGESAFWTDALSSLAKRMPAYQSSEIQIIDWGMTNTLRLLDRGALHLLDITYLLIPEEVKGQDAYALQTVISDPNRIFLGYVEEHEAFKGVGAHLARFAQQHGYEAATLETVNDRNGRPVFRIFRFLKSRN